MGIIDLLKSVIVLTKSNYGKIRARNVLKLGVLSVHPVVHEVWHSNNSKIRWVHGLKFSTYKIMSLIRGHSQRRNLNYSDINIKVKQGYRFFVWKQKLFIQVGLGYFDSIATLVAIIWHEIRLLTFKNYGWYFLSVKLTSCVLRHFPVNLFLIHSH